MKIKEVEQRVGITSKNIRFYEKEGLITPKRNEENNYRDYCEEDILLLERIKILRVLGISIPDIKKLNEGCLDLESEGKSRFYAIQAGGRIMNFIGVVFSMRGKTNGPLVYR